MKKINEPQFFSDPLTLPMKLKEKERSYYYQEIARHFLTKRGTPFFLSSKDLELISDWEREGIPLRIVLEGISLAFENLRKRGGAKDKVLSLSFCRGEVMKALHLFRERKIGGIKPVLSEDRRKGQLLAEIRQFLENFPPGMPDLERIFLKARLLISRKTVSEDRLEIMDGEVDDILVSCALEPERESVKKEILEEFRNIPGEEYDRIFRLKLTKFLRHKHRIPYLSLFYY